MKKEYLKGKKRLREREAERTEEKARLCYFGLLVFSLVCTICFASVFFFLVKSDIHSETN